MSNDYVLELLQQNLLSAKPSKVNKNVSKCI